MCEITFEPFEWDASNAIVFKFRKENVVINSIECFFKINENSKGYIPIVQIFGNAQNQVSKGEFRGSFFPETVLGGRENVFFVKEINKLFINK